MDEVLNAFDTDISDRRIQNLGVMTTIALFLQMRYSQTARRTVSNVVQGSIALGLCSISITTLGSMHCKKRLVKFLKSKLTKTDLQVASNDGASSLERRFLGRSSIMAIPTILQSFLSRLRRDDKLRRRWQGVVALVVLYYFRYLRKYGRMRKLGKSPLTQH